MSIRDRLTILEGFASLCLAYVIAWTATKQQAESNYGALVKR